MHGRMIHVRENGKYVRQAQIYDPHGRVSVVPHSPKAKLTVAESAGYGPHLAQQDPVGLS
jgi:hypothetical protein